MPTKSKILFLFILSLQVVCSQEIVLSQNLDNTVQQGSVTCAAEDITDNVYMRAYDLASLGYSEFEVSSVDFVFSTLQMMTETIQLRLLYIRLIRFPTEI